MLSRFCISLSCLQNVANSRLLTVLRANVSKNQTNLKIRGNGDTFMFCCRSYSNEMNEHYKYSSHRTKSHQELLGGLGQHSFWRFHPLAKVSFYFRPGVSGLKSRPFSPTRELYITYYCILLITGKNLLRSNDFTL